MKKNNLPQTKLRCQAEANSSKSEQGKMTVAGMDTTTLNLIRELQAHQVELEAQNEELQARVEIEAALRQYANLYDFAPIGYFILRCDGTIQQANLSGGDLLGINREELIEQRFGQFVSAEFCSVFDSFLETVFSGHGKEACEIVLLKNKHEPIWVRVDATCSDASFQQGTCHIVVSDITEHKRAEQAWPNALERLKELEMIVNRSPAIVFLWRAAEGWPVEFVSDNINQFGYSPADFTSGRIPYAQIVHPDDLERVAEDVSQYSRDGCNEFCQEYRILTPSGDVRWFDDRTWVRRDSTGTITHYQGIVIDITARKRAEESLRKAHAKLERRAEEHTAELVQANSRLKEEIAERKRAEEALRESEERYKSMFEDSPISLWEEDFSRIKAYFDDLRASGITDFRTYFESHPEAVIHCAGLVKVLDVNQATLTLLEGTDKEILLAGLSKVFADKELKVFREELITMAEGGQKFESNEEIHRTLTGKEKFVTIHTSVAPGYEHSLGKVLVSLIDVTEHKRAEEALRKSEARYHSIIEDQTELICRYLPDGRLSFVNQAYARYYDETARRLINTNFIPQIPEPDMSMVLNKISEITPQEPSVVYEHRIIKPDGEIRWQTWTHRGIYDADGNLIEHQAVGNDITERKRAEKALRESEERYRSLVEIAPEAIVVHSKGKIIYGNPAARQLYGGQSLEDFVGKPALDFVHPDYRQIAIERIRKSFEKREPAERTEEKHVRLDGQVVCVEVTTVPINYVDEPATLLIITNITERKRSEEALQASQQQLERQKLFLEAMLSAMPIPVFYKDTQGRYLGCNRAYTEVMGIELTEFKGKTAYDLWPHELAETYHRMDMELFENPGPQIYEAKVRNKSGEMRDVIFRKDVFRNEDGSIGGIIGTHFDITERKQIEERIAKERENFLKIFAAAPVGLLLLDYNTVITKANQSVADLILRNPVDIIGKRAGEGLGCVNSQESPQGCGFGKNCPNCVLRQGLESVLAGGPSIQGAEIALTLLINNGQFQKRWLSIGAEPIELDGKRHIVVAIDDITERKRAEEKLQRYLSELKVLYDNGLAISALLEPREIGRKIIETLSRELSWHHIVIRLRCGETDDLELVAFNQPNIDEQATAELEKRLKTLVSKVGEGLSGWSVQIGQAIRTGNVQKHPQYVDTFSGLHSGMYIPLTVGERVIGCIAVESEAKNAFTEQDERLLTTLAAQTAIAFENARLYQDIQQELQERERAEAALAKEKAFTETALDSQRDTFFVFEVSGRANRWNRIFRDTTGYSNEEIASLKAPDSYFSPEDLEKITSFAKTIILDRNGRIELNLICKDGRKIPTEYEVSLIQDKTGETNYIIAIGRDITERKQAEEQIQLLAKFPAEDPNPVLRVAGDGTLLYINEAGLSHLPQWNLQVGKAVLSLLWEAISQSMQNGTTQTLDLEHGDRLYAFYVAPIVSAGYANLYGHDITESRQVKALQDAKARYHILFEQAPHGVLLAELDTGKIIEANELASQQLGYTREEFAKMKISDYEASEKPEQITQRMQKIISEGNNDFETLHRAKSGEVRNVHVWVKTLQMNERILFYAILQDITEQKRMEEANETYNREITLLEERQRIASDLHDAVSQTLFSARLTAEMLLRQPDRQADAFTRSLMDLNRLVRSASGEVRLILVELRNNALLNVSLETLLANLIDSGMARTNANLIFQCQVEDLILPAKVKLAFYRIAQEATSNAIKHGKPGNIQCTLRDNEQTLEMLIQDDGLGFSDDKVSDDNKMSDDHFGLQIMRERAEQVGLKLAITSQPGEGTSVAVCWEKEQG